MIRKRKHSKKPLLTTAAKSVIFKKKTLLGVLFVILTSIVCDTICFFGNSRTQAQFVINRPDNSPIISTINFSYTSDIITKKRRDQNADMIVPSYKIDEKSLNDFDTAINALLKEFGEIEKSYAMLSAEQKTQSKTYDDFAETLRKTARVNINPADLQIILENTNDDDFAKKFKYAAFPCKNILKSGVYADSDPTFTSKAASNINFANIDGKRSESQARRELRRNINAIGYNENLSHALFRVFSNMIRPNIAYDEETTVKNKTEARNAVKPVVVQVKEGDIIAESTKDILPLVQEKIIEYRKALAAAKKASDKMGLGSLSNFTISIFLISAAALFITVSKNPKSKRKQTIFSFVTLLILNLLFIRFFIDFTEKATLLGSSSLVYFAYALPVLIGPVIQALIATAYTGFVLSLMLCAFSTIMIGESLEFFIIAFIATLASVYACEKATSRNRIMWSCFFSGVIVSLGCLFTNMAENENLETIAIQSLNAVIVGFVSGLIILGVLRWFEQMFDSCSNITLFGLSDYSNNLLSELQRDAPGTFLHSIMVSQLAERAAKEIKANYMLCRVGALYHDIGKITKPHFFSENQRGMDNPHDGQSPSMSALIIKNHISEGREKAEDNNLPRQICDIIQQHHGTSIISYFYAKAQKAVAETKQSNLENALRMAGVDESTYRYDGPKPQSAEAAIIMLADSCEAASRSLKKVSPHSVDELITKIFHAKMTDGQLDDAPITVKQLTRIRESFAFSLLNIYHTRVEYPDDAKQKRK